MNLSCDIENVGQRIRYTIAEFEKMGILPDEPKAIYEEYEQLAISHLDGDHMNWPDGILEHYLQVFLFCIQRELGIAETL